ncbi:CD3324 family protein [Vallitalea okinawensis]|uniref:CD3324 family protein n=1 Tax=Vallitalea okinawensis TaxID=2078660 RepID=UPI000CFC8CA6|nr:CD3324 family protein [Vallitalea okinawensis]
MNYINAKKILPDHLIKEIQGYIQGGYVYIPSQAEKRKGWGEKSGSREYLNNRNEAIRNKYSNGNTIANLSKEYFLSVDSIKKIIYTKSE